MHLPQHVLRLPPVVGTLACILTSSNHLSTPCKVTVDPPVTNPSYAVAKVCSSCALQKFCNAPLLPNSEHKAWPDTKSPAQCCQSKKPPLH